MAETNETMEKEQEPVITPEPAEPTPVPEQETAMPTEAVPEQEAANAGEEVPVSEVVPEPAPKKKSKKMIAIVCAAVVVVLAVAAIVGIRLFGGKDTEEKREQNYSFMLKDNSLFYLDDTMEKPVEITDNVYEDKDEQSGNYIEDGNVAVNQDKTKILYCRMIDTEKKTYSLYYRSLKNLKKEPVKIAEDVVSFVLMPKDKGVLFKDVEGTVYMHDYEERSKILSDAKTTHFSEDCKYIIFTSEDDDLYRMEIGGEREKIDSDIDSCEKISKDFQTIYYLKDSTLYVKKADAEKSKIDSNIDEIIKIYDSGEAFFTKKAKKAEKDNKKAEDDDKKSDESKTTDESKITLYDFVTEDKGQEDRDEEIKEMEPKTDNEYELRRDAMVRIWVREAMRNIKLDVNTEGLLYYYNGEKTDQISKSFSGKYRCATKTPVMVCKTYEEIKVNKPSLTEVVAEIDKEIKYIDTWESGEYIYQEDFEKCEYYDTLKKIVLGAI